MDSAIGTSLMALGLAFEVVGCLGLVRLPDFYSRMQAATKCVALGTMLIIVGAVVTVGTFSAAYRSGTPLWERSVVDQLADDAEGRQ